MFSKEVPNSKITPNLINSIFTNNSVYEMFKDNFEENREYFQNISKEEYLEAMLTYLEKKLFEDTKLEEYNIKAIKLFFDDFLNEKFESDTTNLFKTKLFRGLNYHYAKNYSEEYQSLYNYIFDQTNYIETVKEIITPIIEKSNNDSLTMNEYNILTYYIKNNIKGFIDINLCYNILRLHAFKTNHIFDQEVAKVLVESIVRTITDLNIKVIYDEEQSDKENNELHISPKLLDDFIFGNYVDLLCTLFYNLEQIKDYNNLKNNLVNLDTLKTLETMIIYNVDIDKYINEENYKPKNYLIDLEASSFIKTLRFFQELGVNLYDSYINSHINKIDFSDIDKNEEETINKEISLDIRFLHALKKKDIKYINEYEVLHLLFNEDKTRVKTITLLKQKEEKDFIKEYLCFRIIEPHEMIEDVQLLINTEFNNEEINSLKEQLLKYIYVDSFHYSLNNYINFIKDKDEYLDELYTKVKLIKDTPLTHKFIDEAEVEILDMKQNLI